jgi:hypothetical protein
MGQRLGRIRGMNTDRASAAAVALRFAKVEQRIAARNAATALRHDNPEMRERCLRRLAEARAEVERLRRERDEALAEQAAA